jgi:hypothetical protein
LHQTNGHFSKSCTTWQQEPANSTPQCEKRQINVYEPHEGQKEKKLTPSEQLPMLQKPEILCGKGCKMGQPKRIHTEHKMYIDAKTGDRDQFIYLFIFMFC